MKKKVYLLILLCLFTLTSCVNNDQENIVKISPGTLFEGELKKIEPHLDLLTGYVDLSYKGNKNSFKTIYEIWEKGNVIEKKESISFDGIEDHFNANISVSAKHLDNDEYRLKLIVEGAVSTQQFDLPVNRYYNAINLDKQIEIKDDKEIIIWGLAGTEMNNPFFYSNDIEKTLEAADTALVLKIMFE